MEAEAVASGRERGRPSTGLRPLREADVAAVAALHRRAFGEGGALRGAALERLLGDLLCRHPWPDERLPSLVWEEDGEIVGCVGVLPRPLVIDGRPIVAAVGHNFMVAPGRRAQLAALELLRGYLAGPQDLSIAQGNAASLRLWRATGGAVSIAHSLRWTVPLRPARWALGRMSGRLSGRGLRAAGWRGLAPLAALADRAAAALVRDFAPPPAPATTLDAEPLDVETLCAGLERSTRGRALRPRYSPSELEWMLGLVERAAPPGGLRAVALRRAGELVGWYHWTLRADRTGEVLLLGALGDAPAAVFDHLRHDAWRRGASAIGGQLEPRWLEVVSERGALVHRGRSSPWLLARGPHERALAALLRDEAGVGRLELEWWA